MSTDRLQGSGPTKYRSPLDVLATCDCNTAVVAAEMGISEWVAWNRLQGLADNGLVAPVDPTVPDTDRVWKLTDTGRARVTADPEGVTA